MRLDVMCVYVYQLFSEANKMQQQKQQQKHKISTPSRLRLLKL